MMKEKLLSLFYHFVVAVCVLWRTTKKEEDWFFAQKLPNKKTKITKWKRIPGWTNMYFGYFVSLFPSHSFTSTSNSLAILLPLFLEEQIKDHHPLFYIQHLCCILYFEMLNHPWKMSIPFQKMIINMNGTSEVNLNYDTVNTCRSFESKWSWDWIWSIIWTRNSTRREGARCCTLMWKLAIYRFLGFFFWFVYAAIR